MNKPTAFILGLAFTMYDTYCESVGGKAFNGDPLPPANEFFADETKTKQSKAWLDAAEAASIYSGSVPPTDPTETFMDRLIKEHKELEDRHEKLLSFLIRDNAKEIVGVVQHELMTEQSNHMNQYRNTLEKRIDDLKTKN